MIFIYKTHTMLICFSCFLL